MSTDNKIFRCKSCNYDIYTEYRCSYDICKRCVYSAMIDCELNNADNEPIKLDENTACALFNGIYKWNNFTNIPTTVLHDFFGSINIENDNYTNIIFGLYSDLIKSKGITPSLLNKCYLSNRLDELIHKKFTFHKSYYYEMFKNNNIIIGKTFYGKYDLTDFTINNDDYCLFCNEKGVYTKENYINAGQGTDCYYCYKQVCKKCSYFDTNKSIGSYIHYNCFINEDNDINNIDLNTNLKNNISNKIANCINYDNRRFKIKGNISYNDIIELLKIQSAKCYICNENVLLTGYKANCCYQFSIDRIDNNLPHNRTNVLISCYYCNCRNHPAYIDNNKICQNKCHTISKSNILNRKSVNINVINKLRLK